MRLSGLTIWGSYTVIALCVTLGQNEAYQVSQRDKESDGGIGRNRGRERKREMRMRKKGRNKAKTGQRQGQRERKYKGSILVVSFTYCRQQTVTIKNEITNHKAISLST